ncbi:MAG: hypothetical protein GWN58_05690, partial [Anaerolineae bacterium]|nr:hypothetical protein [Anaerolineae bacterium]
NGRTEAGIAAGISTYEFDLSLAGDSIINEDVGGQPGNGPPDDPIVEHVRSETEILAPIPTLGIFLRHALTPALQF